MLAVVASLLVGSRGAWGAVAIPATFLGLGLVLLLATGEPSPYGGDADPLRLIGGSLVVVSVPWAVLTCIVVAVVHRRRRNSPGASAL